MPNTELVWQVFDERLQEREEALKSLKDQLEQLHHDYVRSAVERSLFELTMAEDQRATVALKRLEQRVKQKRAQVAEARTAMEELREIRVQWEAELPSRLADALKVLELE